MKNKNISPETIKRLSVYLRYLEMMRLQGCDTISSEQFSSILNMPSTQFRKDLSYFGEFGKRGVGYEVGPLISAIRGIMGVEKVTEAIVAGVGKLGSALIRYPGFSILNVSIVAAFDSNKDKIDTCINGIRISDVKNISDFIAEKKIHIAILTVPGGEASEVAGKMIDAGIRGILNFAPVSLKSGEGIFISNVDMASELGGLIFKLSQS